MQATITRPAPRPATAADLWRLADQGRVNGVRLLSECVSGARYATSVSAPGVIYSLTVSSCTCPGFTYVGRCQHHSLLLFELGWLLEVAPDEPSPAPIRRCPLCLGEGSLADPDAPWRKERCARGCPIPGAIRQERPTGARPMTTSSRSPLRLIPGHEDVAADEAASDHEPDPRPCPTCGGEGDCPDCDWEAREDVDWKGLDLPAELDPPYGPPEGGVTTADEMAEWMTGGDAGVQRPFRWPRRPGRRPNGSEYRAP